MASIMRRVVDTDTADRLDEANVDLSDFTKVEDWIRKRESRLRARGGASAGLKDSNAMVYGVTAAEAAPAAPAQGANATAQECPPSDPWAGGMADPWTGAAAQQPAAQPPPQPEADWFLDAFGQGKGGKGPIQCYNCLGEGHPSFLCQSAKGAGKAGTGPVCGTCRGKGHDAANCASKGGGKYVPKGKGKGDGGKPNFP